MDCSGKQFRKRNAVLACLRASKAHPSAEELYDLLRREHSDISLASVYRNLAHFKEQGQVISLGTVNGVERFDGCVDPHIHFACNHCGKVVDVPEVELPRALSGSVASSLGCRVEEVNLLFGGTCRECLNVIPESAMSGS